MPVAHARSGPSASATMVSLDVDDLVSMFARRNPSAKLSELTLVGQIVAAFSATAVQLSPVDRMQLSARTAQLKDLIANLVAETDATDGQPLPHSTELTAPPMLDAVIGEGMEKRVSRRESWARADEDSALAKLIDWAGPVAQPIELRRQHGIARSSLQHWHRSGMVVGLRVGVSKLAFPTEQFIDGRPITGLGAVVAAIGDPHAAWLWLRQRNPEVGDIWPLTRLKSGAIGEVVEVAYASYG